MKIFRENMWARRIAMFTLDVMLVLLSVYLSMELRFEMYIPYRHVETMLASLPLVVALCRRQGYGQALSAQQYSLRRHALPQ